MVEKRLYTSTIKLSSSQIGLFIKAFTLHLDYKGSSMGMWFGPPKSSNHAVGEEYPLNGAGEFTEKGPAGVRDIKHKLRDINCEIDRNSDFLSIYNSRIVLKLSCECGGPIEVKRYGKGLLGKYRDAYAYDVNLTKFEITIYFAIGDKEQNISVDNIIHDVEVEVDLEAELSNVPDSWERWGIVDRRISKRIEETMKKRLESVGVRDLLYRSLDALFTPELLSLFTGKEIENVCNFYTYGDELCVKCEVWEEVIGPTTKVILSEKEKERIERLIEGSKKHLDFKDELRKREMEV